MDEKTVLHQLLNAHRLLRHDLLNNLQVISGFQQIGQQQKSAEYIQTTISYLRRFNRLTGIPEPYLQALLTGYLAQYPDETALKVDVEQGYVISPPAGPLAAELLGRLMKLLEQPLQSGGISCRVLFSTEPGVAFYLELEGKEDILSPLADEYLPLLEGSTFSHNLEANGNILRVKIMHKE